MQKNKYPRLFIRSKSDLAKHISHKKFSYKEALSLINDVGENFDKYWKDNIKDSEPSKHKYVRHAYHKSLDLLLKKINITMLLRHDTMLPKFIFGGVKGKDHIDAAKNLLGKYRKRTLLGLDIERFFEKTSSDNVIEFFQKRCHCSRKISRLLASFCCVPIGPKGSLTNEKTIARGFCTSSRLSIWCSLEIFNKLNSLVFKRLKGHDPRLSVYVDDIGITASRVSKEQMDRLYKEIEDLFLSDSSHPLPLKHSKKRVVSHEEGDKMQVMGITLARNKVLVGPKVKQKIVKAKRLLSNPDQQENKQKIFVSLKGLRTYKNHVEKVD